MGRTGSCTPIKSGFSESDCRRQWQLTPVLLSGRSHGQRSLVGCSPWGLEESDTTERLHFHLSLPLIGEGNGTPLQCSCLENPRDGGAWWAAVYGVAHSRTRLKRLSSSSSTVVKFIETENTVVVAKGWEKRNGKLVFSGYWRTWKSSGGGWW